MKRPSLFHQLLTSLRAQIKFGHSKHQAKRIAIARAHRMGRSGFGVAPAGIFSVDSFAGYRQVCHEFAAWCRKHGYARTMEEARYYVGFYLQERIDRGLSAWTIYRDRSALRKAYQDPDLAWQIELPRRKLKDIKRSRVPVSMDAKFNEADYSDLVDFETATGLRRHELVAIRPINIYWKGNKLIAFVLKGKGGKPREVTVLGCMKIRVLQIIKGRDPYRPIFSDVPEEMDVHSYRRQYAQARMQQDGASEQEVTRDLGHERVEVMRGHYTR